MDAELAAPEAKRARIDCNSVEEDSMASNRLRVVLVMCGSFSPITFLHLRLFELARDALHSSGKYLVNKGIISPVHDSYGKKGLVPSEHRLEMCKLAVKHSDWIRVDPWESKQEKWSTTVRVLRHLQRVESSENTAPVSVKLLCGADLLESFATPDLWKPEDIEEIVSKFGLVVVSRSGSNPERFVYESDQLNALKKHIHLVTEWIGNDVSSTKIRRSLARGESVRYLIPDSVIDYIKQNKLYQCDHSRPKL